MPQPKFSENTGSQFSTSEWYSYGFQHTPVSLSAYSGTQFSLDTNASLESGYLSTGSPCTSNSLNTSVASDDIYFTDHSKNQQSPLKMKSVGMHLRENILDTHAMHASSQTNDAMPVIGLDDWDSQFINTFQENLFTLPDLDLEGINIDELIAKSPVRTHRPQQSQLGDNLIHIPNVSKNNSKLMKNEFVPLENKTQTYLNNLNQMPLELSQDTYSRPNHISTQPIYIAPKCDKPTVCQNVPIMCRGRRHQFRENLEGSRYRPREKLNAAREMFKKTLDKAVQKEVRKSRRKQFPNIKKALETFENC